jgi:hypothetical protein
MISKDVWMDDFDPYLIQASFVVATGVDCVDV